MEDKDIKLTKLKQKEWKWLSKIKIDFDLKSINDVISNLKKLVNKLSLMKEFQIVVESEVKIR